MVRIMYCGICKAARWKVIWGAILLGILLFVAGDGLAEEHSEEVAATNELHGVAAEGLRPGVVRRIVCYLPDRVLDLFDIFRARVTFGPGLAVKGRVTDYVSFYGGSHRVAYVGLPGPRYPEKVKWPVGLEREKGIVFLGVDATDDFDCEADYSSTEIGGGVHLFVVGADVGFDIVEFVDFLAGLVLIDLKDDDLCTDICRAKRRSAITRE